MALERRRWPSQHLRDEYGGVFPFGIVDLGGVAGAIVILGLSAHRSIVLDAAIGLLRGSFAWLYQMSMLPISND